MHSASKRKNNPPKTEDWENCYYCSGGPCACYDWDDGDDYDDHYNCAYCCSGYPCTCNNHELSEIHHIVAKAYADRIITDTAIGYNIKDFIIQERLTRYTHFYGEPNKHDELFKEDMAFAWKMLKGTPDGNKIFSSFFGAKEE